MARANEKTSPGVQLWMILAVLAVLSIALGAAYFLLTHREMAVVFRDLRPTEAAAIVAELEAETIPYELREGGTTILVGADQADAVRLRIAGADLPVKGIDGFELFDTSDLGLTDFAQRIKFQRAMQGELARTIMKIDGITEARVHLSIPERSVFRGDRVRAKAAVTLLTRAPDIETPAMIEGVQELVAAAIADLAPADVVIVNGHGRVISHARQANALPLLARSDIPAVTAAIIAALPRAAPAVSVETRPGSAADGTPAPAVPVQVHVATAAPLSDADKAAALASLGAIDPAVLPAGTPIAFDAITSAGLMPQQAPASLADLQAEPAGPPLPGKAADRIDGGPASGAIPALDLLAAFLLLVAIVGAFAFVILRRARPILSVEDQRRFADKLRLGLKSQTQEPGDAA